MRNIIIVNRGRLTYLVGGLGVCDSTAEGGRIFTKIWPLLIEPSLMGRTHRFTMMTFVAKITMRIREI